MKILILGALGKEIFFLNKFIDTKSNDGFYLAKINNNEIFTAVTGVGILNAFAKTYSLMEEIHPDIVFNIGTAGGHTLDVEDGDVVVCDEAIYHGGYIMNENPASSWDVIKETELVLKGDERFFQKS